MLEATAAEITSATGGEVLPVQLDIRDAAAVAEAVDKIEEQLGLPSVVVHNAAGIKHSKKTSALTLQCYQETLFPQPSDCLQTPSRLFLTLSSRAQHSLP